MRRAAQSDEMKEKGVGRRRIGRGRRAPDRNSNAEVVHILRRSAQTHKDGRIFSLRDGIGTGREFRANWCLLYA